MGLNQLRYITGIYPLTQSFKIYSYKNHKLIYLKNGRFNKYFILSALTNNIYRLYFANKKNWSQIIIQNLVIQYSQRNNLRS